MSQTAQCELKSLIFSFTIVVVFFVFFLSEPLGFVRNLQVTDPTTSTLNVRWEPPEGKVREYIVIWTPVAGGEQEVVRPH